MTKPRGHMWKVAALVGLFAGAVFILGATPRSADRTSAAVPTSAATRVHPTGTSIPAVAVQPSLLPPTSLPTEIAPTETQKPQPATALPAAQSVALQSKPGEQPTIVPPPPTKPVPNQFTIRFTPGTTAEQQQAYVRQLGGTISQTIDALNTVVVTIPDTASAQALPRSPLVVQTEPDFYVTAQQSAPNDFYYSQQWALPVMQVPDAWPLLPSNAPTVAVAVIDSGICANHPDLAGRILPGYDFVENDSDPEDTYHHGCEVSGVIAANTNNNLGVAGIAPNARIMPVRVLDADGNGFYSNVIAGIIYAADHGAQIINLSLGGDVPSTTMQEAVDYAVARGVLVIAAAGNAYGGPVMYPAAYPNVVAVASVDSDLQPSGFNAVGPEVDLFAPGRNILTTTLNGDYIANMGTSFAAPQVAGIAALEIGRGKSLIVDGGIVHADIPVPVPTLTPTTQPIIDKHGNVVPQTIENEPVPTDTWAVILDPGSDPNAVAAQLGYENLGQIGNLPDTYLFRIPATGSSLQAAQDTASAMGANAQVVSFQQQFAQQQFTRDPNDEPLYMTSTGEQWHLRNQYPGWVTLNLPSGWVGGTATGSGVQIAIVDDGLEHTHRDLAPNVVLADSYDFNDNDSDPAPRAPVLNVQCGTNADCHGTAAAGVAAAADNPPPVLPAEYDYCGVGVAYGANLAGIRLIAGPSTPAMEASALSYHYNANEIFSNSWGPSDNGFTLDGPEQIVKDAMLDAITHGRNNLGSIYVWAAGNGRQNNDNINADGYANSRFVIAVGATNEGGHYADYSEPGAPMLVTAPSSSSSAGIATTDLMDVSGYNTGSPGTDYDFTSCTRKFGGTSAATPMVAGVVALMLQANPNLTWRDAQYILVNTARKNVPFESDWQVNGAGKHINHNYGFGLIDADAAVTAAQTWTNVAPEISATSQLVTVNGTIPDNNPTGVASTVNFDANINVEHVEVVFNAQHTYRGDLAITLVSPDGTESRLMEPRLDSADNYSNWTFTTVRDWGEHSAGVWTLRVVDLALEDLGTFQNWQMTVYGTAAPPKQPTPIAPTNGVAFTTSLPWNTTTFSWNLINVVANKLELQIDTVNPPVAAPIELPGTPSSYVSNLPLGTYYWRVRAVDNDPSTTEPDWNTITPRSLTIQTSTNQPPARNYFTTDAPVLSWANLSWATAYQIEISTTSTFTIASRVLLTPDGTGLDPALPPTDLTFTVVPPLGEGVYYWRVRGRKPDGTWSTTWSVYDSFIVDL